MPLKMTTSTLIILSFFLLFSCATCFNITRILNTYSEFQTFNNYLNQTKINLEINNRRTITVLAVSNDAMGVISGSDEESLTRIMSTHVILDYYDKDKLNKLPKSITGVTTLFQSSGDAMKGQGFLNITRVPGGGFIVGSAVNGAQANARFIREVAAQPYNISVMQISNPIYVPGIQNNSQTTQPPPPPPKTPPPKSSEEESPAPAPDSEAPAADAPDADAPAADAPASAPSPSPVADAPGDDAADGPAGSSKDADSAAGTRVTAAALAGTVMAAISSWVALL